MGRFEDVDLAVAALEGGDAEPDLRLAEPALAKLTLQDAHERPAVVSKLEVLADLPQAAFRRSEEIASDRGEDLAAALDVEIAQLCGGEAGPDAKGKNAAGGGAGDEVEMSRNRRATEIALLQSRQESGRIDAADAAAINGQDAEVAVLGPVKRRAALLEGPGGSSERGLFVRHAGASSIVMWRPPPVHFPVASQPS